MSDPNPSPPPPRATTFDLAKHEALARARDRADKAAYQAEADRHFGLMVEWYRNHPETLAEPATGIEEPPGWRAASTPERYAELWERARRQVAEERAEAIEELAGAAGELAGVAEERTVAHAGKHRAPAGKHRAPAGQGEFDAARSPQDAAAETIGILADIAEVQRAQRTLEQQAPDRGGPGQDGDAGFGM